MNRNKSDMIKDALVESMSQGTTVEEACKAAECSRQSFYRWYGQDNDFSERIDEAQKSRIQAVKNALFKRAEGFEITEVHSKEVLDKNGKIKKIKVKEVTKHFAPDTGAGIFLITNWAPEEFKNRQHIDHAGEIKTGDKDLKEMAKANGCEDSRDFLKKVLNGEIDPKTLKKNE